jgi:hypothetical protein
MSDDALGIYLQDHLAGAAGAVELLEALEKRHAGESIAEFAGEIRAEVEEDRGPLEDLAERVGGGSHPVKEAAAWLAEKATRIKIGRGTAGELGAFEGLEALALGIWGKRALWRALAVLSTSDSRLQGLDLDRLITRAESQHARVEEFRLRTAPNALRARG